MKIAIFGDVSDRIALQEAIQEIQNDIDVEVVDIDIFDEAKTIVLTAIPLVSELLTCSSVCVPYKDNSFRGGSIGKGGKIKYRRG